MRDATGKNAGGFYFPGNKQFFFQPLSVRNVMVDGHLGDGAVFMEDGGVGDHKSSSVLRTHHFHLRLFAQFHPVEGAPRTGMVEIVQHLVAFLPGGVIADPFDHL